MSRRMSSRHLPGSYRERKWPYQWIGQCTCGVGIRCNSKEAVDAFFKEQGCVR